MSPDLRQPRGTVTITAAPSNTSPAMLTQHLLNQSMNGCRDYKRQTSFMKLPLIRAVSLAMQLFWSVLKALRT